MGTITIEQALLAAQPVQSGSLSAFTSRVMLAAKRSAHYRGYKKRRISGLGWLLRLSPIALGAVVVAVLAAAATTTYAIFLLWGKPAAHVQETSQNQFGRQQAVISFENCKYFKKDSATFEVKAGVTLDQAELEKIANARCERDQIVNWVTRTWPPFKEAAQVERGETVVIEDITATTLSFYDMREQHLTLPILPDSRIIVEGADEPLSKLKQGDVVLVAVTSTFPPDGHGPAIKREVQAIIKLSLPFEYYTSKQALLTERKPCSGNPQSSCLFTGSGVQLYPHFNHKTKQPTPETIWEIQGKLVRHNAHSLTLQSSAGDRYVIHTPFDIVDDHNQNWKRTYKNTTVELGDTVAVSYTQPASANRKDIADDEILAVTLLAEQQVPIGTWVKY